MLKLIIYQLYTDFLIMLMGIYGDLKRLTIFSSEFVQMFLGKTYYLQMPNHFVQYGLHENEKGEFLSNMNVLS